MTARVVANENAGAWVDDVDLGKPSASDIDLIKQALGNYGVAFFRNQSLSPESHIRMAECFGPININRFFSAVENYPQIAQVLKEPEQKQNIGESWHADHSYDQVPAMGSILVARELPTSGGDTLFVNLIAAYEALDPATKNRLEGLSATHSSRHVFGAKAYDDDNRDDLKGRLGNTAKATQDAVHPLVIRHPFSDRPVLYVNPQFTTHINELDSEDSKALLEQLYSHCLKEEFHYRFNWQEGSVAFWDNRASWHRALNDYPNQRRLMHRITVEGTPLEKLH